MPLSSRLLKSHAAVVVTLIVSRLVPGLEMFFSKERGWNRSLLSLTEDFQQQKVKIVLLLKRKYQTSCLVFLHLKVCIST